MLVLVSGANFFVMFIGWEGIGVVSYLLINFWFTRIQANKAAILAFTMNRVGDMGLSIGFFAIFALFGSLDFSTVFSLVPLINETGITIIGLLLLMGAMAKSAQIPLHSWLPGSMEGPTPVSALIHAATLVTAGLYLLVRSSPLLEYSSTALLVITLVGASTAFFAATCGLVQNDLKRIIAFSTISQLGYMVMAVGLSQYNVALMHVINHAFFKALLFLGAGAVIHSFSDQQDVRRLGGLINFLPFTYTAMLVGSLSLLATPWLTGFYSKDLIIELAYGQYSFSGTYAYILGSLTAGITAFYSFRLISLVFLTVPNGPKNSYLNSHEANLAIIVPLFVLALFSIFFGFVFSDLFVGMGSDFFQNSIFMHPKNISLIEAEFSLSSPALAGYAGSFDPSPYLSTLALQPNPSPLSLGEGVAAQGVAVQGEGQQMQNLACADSLSQRGSNNILIKLLPVILSFTGALSAIILYHLPFGLFLINLTNNKIGRNLYAFLNGKYYFDVIYNHFIIQSGLKLGYNISKEMDRGAIEFLGPYGLSNYFYNAGKNLAKLDTGVITTYSLYIILALISLLFILFYPALALATNYSADPQSLEEIRLFIIYITSALIVLSPSFVKESL
jgi:NADH-ubiquinone oxidoreductase chain 5